MSHDIPVAHKCGYNFLGRSSLRVSNICLGAMTFGESRLNIPNQLDEAGSHQLIERFVQWGGNFLDTANVYGRGKSETIVGSWLAQQERDRFVIASKVRFSMDDSNPNAVGIGRRHIIHSVEQSLQRLQTDYIDLYQTHLWDDASPVQETLRTLDDLVRCGKVRYLGVSNVSGWQLQRIVDLTEKLGLNPFISLQQQYSLASRDSELEAFQVCKLNGLGVLPWSPLKGGLLTGKVKRSEKPQEGRLAWAAEDTSRNYEITPNWVNFKDQTQIWEIIDKLRDIAGKHGKSLAQVALRWLLQKPVVSSVIIGATKMNQLDDNMAAASGWELTADEMKQLDEVSDPAFPYPYNMIKRMNSDRKNPWNLSSYD